MGHYVNNWSSINTGGQERRWINWLMNGYTHRLFGAAVHCQHLHTWSYVTILSLMTKQSVALWHNYYWSKHINTNTHMYIHTPTHIHACTHTHTLITAHAELKIHRIFGICVCPIPCQVVGRHCDKSGYSSIILLRNPLSNWHFREV